MEIVTLASTSSVDVHGWHRSSVRQGVFDPEHPTQLSNEFKLWQERCLGRVIVQREPSDPDQNPARLLPYAVYMELAEDHASYLLTFDEMEMRISFDSAAFYAPYIPLTFYSGLKYKSSSDKLSFVTRYD